MRHFQLFSPKSGRVLKFDFGALRTLFQLQHTPFFVFVCTNAQLRFRLQVDLFVGPRATVCELPEGIVTGSFTLVNYDFCSWNQFLEGVCTTNVETISFCHMNLAVTRLYCPSVPLN